MKSLTTQQSILRLLGLITFGASFGLFWTVSTATAETSPEHATGDASEQPLGVTTEEPAPQRLGFGLGIGYGYGIAPRSQQSGSDAAEVQILTLEPQVRLLLERFGTGRAWYHGDLEGTLQGLLVINFSPETGVGGGATVGLRYRMMIEKRIQPFFEGGLGFGGIDFNLASQDDGFEFFIEAGVGARYRISSSIALAASLHWQHISNAQTHLPNVGIDTIGFMLAIETP